MWREQWERVQRTFEWVKTFTQESTPGAPNETTDDRKDRVASFFLHCYHLKDWLKNDPASKAQARDVETELNKNEVMQIVADLANGTKHGDLTVGRYGPKTGDPTTALTRQDIVVTTGAAGAGTLQKMYVESNTDEWDVYNLAKYAVAWWSEFLTQRNLLP